MFWNPNQISQLIDVIGRSQLYMRAKFSFFKINNEKRANCCIHSTVAAFSRCIPILRLGCAVVDLFTTLPSVLHEQTATVAAP